MNRKVMKVLSIMLMVLMVVTMLSTSVFAADEKTTSAVSSDQFMNLNQFNNKSHDQETANVFQRFISTAINLVQIVGMAVAIIMLIVMAIKYISAAPSEKAEIKKGVTIYVVGAVVLFAATGILQVIKNFASANISADNNDAPISVIEIVDLDEMYLG